MEQGSAAVVMPAGGQAQEWELFTRTGPGTPAGRYLRAFWQPVYHAMDVAPGEAKPLRIMSESYTLYRGESGTLHLLERSCPHRGTRLSVGHVEGDAIRCFYHGWKFSGDGQCLEQPAEESRFADRIKVRSYPVREYLGLVFAYLGGGEPPEFPRYPEFEHFEGMVEVDSYRRDCNYFQNVDNALDHTHLQFVHEAVAKGALRDIVTARHIRIEESDWGLTLTQTRSDGQVFISQYGMPNMIEVAALPIDAEMGWKESLFWWVPVEDHVHIQFGINTVRATGEAARRLAQKRQARRSEVDQAHQRVADDILAGRIKMSEVDPARCDMVKLQDDVAQIGQLRIAEREAENLGASDAGVVRVRRLWRREIQALAEGRPIKRWRKPATVRPVVWGFGATPVRAPATPEEAEKLKPTIVDVRPYVEIELQMQLLGAEPEPS